MSDEKETTPPLPIFTNTENKEETSSFNHKFQASTGRMESEDELIDYNPQFNIILATSNQSATESSQSPAGIPMSLQEEQDEDMSDSRVEKSETHSELTVRAELQLTKQDAL